MSDPPEDTLLSHNKISVEPEYQAKSEYLPSIDPEPPPYMTQGFTCTPTIHGLCMPCPSINYNTASCKGSLLLTPIQRYILIQILHLNNIRMTIQYLLDMGSSILVKELIDLIILYIYKTKFIM